jgi:hypothetical protein
VKLVAFSLSPALPPAPGLLVDQGRAVLDLTHPATGLPKPTHALSVCDLADPFHRAVRSLATWAATNEHLARLRTAGAVHARDTVTLHAPVPRPAAPPAAMTQHQAWPQNCAGARGAAAAHTKFNLGRSRHGFQAGLTRANQHHRATTGSA